MSHVLIAADKFKGSLTAAQVAAAVSAGIHRVRPEVPIVAVPVADGGDGTLAAALAAGYREVAVTAAGPTGKSVATRYARDGEFAVVELADVSGLVRLPDGMAAMTATSRGTGEVIAAAIGAGCRRIVLGIGGSACTDGGAGLAQALGAKLRNAAGEEIGDGGGALAELATIDLAPLRARLSGVEVLVACDVVNPLTGPTGAAAVYGPQKGASAADVSVLDAALTHWADVVRASTGGDLRDTAGAGAAGGVGFAALALLDADLRPGTELVFDLVGFHQQLAGAALVITGEGSLDEQTLHGKAPVGVALAARAIGVPVVAVCGRLTLGQEQLHDAGIVAAYSLTELEPDLHRCIAEAAPLLERVGEQIATDHLCSWERIS
ncbi:MAG: glycerate kinase [Actinomycetota bacterium]|nr:glycerate kinase [Actinomycetota bacterium]